MCYVSLLYRYFYPRINSNKISNETTYTAQSFTMVCKKVWCTWNLVYTRTREVSLSTLSSGIQDTVEEEKEQTVYERCLSGSTEEYL